MNQACSATSPVADAPIRQAIYQNQGEINRLQDLIEQLESRLRPVLAPTEPSAQKSIGDAPLPPSSEYEAILRDQAMQMDRLGYRLNNLLTYLAV